MSRNSEPSWIGRMRQVTGQGTLIVANKAVEDALPVVWQMPPGVDVAHDNAVAGRDGWRSVGSLATIGTTNPSPVAVEQLAEAITGVHVPDPCRVGMTVIRSRETQRAALCRQRLRGHRHPMAEAVRWQIREGS